MKLISFDRAQSKQVDRVSLTLKQDPNRIHDKEKRSIWNGMRPWTLTQLFQGSGMALCETSRTYRHPSRLLGQREFLDKCLLKVGDASLPRLRTGFLGTHGPGYATDDALAPLATKPNGPGMRARFV